MGLEPSGRELLVVVIKGTFRFPQGDEPLTHPALHDKQLPLVMADTFTGKPGFSAPVYEVDFAPRKPRCDILLLGQAHAPHGRPASRVDVGLRVGAWHKRFTAVGPRHWDCGLATLRATPPEPFVTQPISYDVAFGGADLAHKDPAQHAAFMANPVGRGFHKHLNKEWVDGKPLPLTEEMNQSVSNPQGHYPPMALGPLGRGWASRAQFAGTYGEEWLDKHFPFLPPDFDEQYYQASPPDQQLPLNAFAAGPTEVVLSNLTGEGLTRLGIPHLVVPIHVQPKRGEREQHTAVLDTLVIEPELRRFTLNWRMARPLKQNLHEIRQVVVGTTGREWWQRRDDVGPATPAPAATLEAADKAI
jgi:hypothetical protein